MTPRHFALLVLAFSCSGCSNGSADTVFVSVSSVSPPPGAFAVSRRAEARVVLAVDVDPASISGASCRIERASDGVPEPATQAFDQATRMLTIAPERALERSTTYRVHLTRDLRTTNGVRFANTIEWTYTTSADAVWERSAVLAQGRLLACEPSRRGGVLAVWAAPDGKLQFARHDGTDWSRHVSVGIGDVHLVDVADNGTGRVVVAANETDGSLHVATMRNGITFGAAEIVAANAFVHVDVDAGDSDHAAVAWADAMFHGSLRMFVPGSGWAPAFSTLASVPHVRLQPAGIAIAVAAFRPGFVGGGGFGSPHPVRFFGDALGGWIPLDPMPVPGLPLADPCGSEARMEDDRVLLAARWPQDAATVCQHGLFGWQLLGPVLGPDLAAGDIAMGPSGAVTIVGIEAGARPFLRRGGFLGFSLEFVGSEPAPPNPTVGVAITGDQYSHLLWTAAAAESAGAPVRLMSGSLAPESGVHEPAVVDGPFAPEEVPVQNLRVVAFGASGAIALWSREGEVRFSLLR